MRLLKDRLQETEAQMARILKAMEHVQTRVKDGLDAKIVESDARMAAEEKSKFNEEEGIRRRVGTVFILSSAFGYDHQYFQTMAVLHRLSAVPQSLVLRAVDSSQKCCRHVIMGQICRMC
jgi:hypothetical protein